MWRSASVSGPSPTSTAATDIRRGSVSTIDFARYDFEARGLDAVARGNAMLRQFERQVSR